MARYSIDGQILTDMADAIRTNKGEAPIEGEFVASTYSGQTSNYEFVEGKTYKLVVTPTSVSSIGGLGIYNSKTYDTVKLFNNADIYFTVGEQKELIFTSPLTADTYLSTTKGLIMAGPYTLEEVDADGNPLYSYTPEDMVTEITAFADRIDPKFLTMVAGADGGASITELPEGITTIRNYAFASMSNLGLTSLPDSITTIGNNGFSYCSNLALTSLPDSITKIGDNAFIGCTKLALTSLPESLTSLGSSSFSGCTNMTIPEKLPTNLTNLSGEAFSRCNTQPRMIIPASVTTVGGRIFGYYANLTLTEVIFLGTPTSIGTSYSGAFQGCNNLTSIKVPWSEGAVANAPWGATNATITYDYVHEEA